MGSERPDTEVWWDPLLAVDGFEEAMMPFRGEFSGVQNIAEVFDAVSHLQQQQPTMQIYQDRHLTLRVLLNRRAPESYAPSWHLPTRDGSRIPNLSLRQPTSSAPFRCVEVQRLYDDHNVLIGRHAFRLGRPKWRRWVMRSSAPGSRQGIERVPPAPSGRLGMPRVR